MRPPAGQQCRDSLLGGGKTVERQTAIAVGLVETMAQVGDCPFAGRDQRVFTLRMAAVSARTQSGHKDGHLGHHLYRDKAAGLARLRAP